MRYNEICLFYKKGIDRDTKKVALNALGPFHWYPLRSLNYKNLQGCS